METMSREVGKVQWLIQRDHCHPRGVSVQPLSLEM